jgi:hypothetical protein
MSTPPSAFKPVMSTSPSVESLASYWSNLLTPTQVSTLVAADVAYATLDAEVNRRALQLQALVAHTSVSHPTFSALQRTLEGISLGFLDRMHGAGVSVHPAASHSPSTHSREAAVCDHRADRAGCATGAASHATAVQASSIAPTTLQRSASEVTIVRPPLLLKLKVIPRLDGIE